MDVGTDERRGASFDNYDGDFARSLNEGMAKIVGHAHSAIDPLTEVSRSHQANELHKTLLTIRERSEGHEFRIIVCGRFNAGKSTLLNALFGTLDHPIEGSQDYGVLPVGRFPTTAVLTDIVYAEEPFVRVWYKEDDRYADWSIGKFLEAGRVRMSEAETKTIFEPIQQFEVGLPVRMLKANVRVSDSPGMGDHPDRDLITRQALLTSDAAIQVLRGETAGGQDERQFGSEVEDSGCRTFKVINTSAGHSTDDDEVRAFWWNRLIGDRIDSVPSVAEFRAKDIYFVDAKQAAMGRVHGDLEVVRASGLLELEATIGSFLVSGRFPAHARKIVRETERVAEGLRRLMRMKQKACRMSSEELERSIRELGPQLRLIEQEERALGTILHGHEQSFVLAGQSAFREFVAGLNKKLTPKLEKEKMSTLSGLSVFSALTGKGKEKVAAEFMVICKRLLGQEFNTFTNATPPAPGLQSALQPEVEALQVAVKEQLGRIQAARNLFSESLELDEKALTQKLGGSLNSHIESQIGDIASGRGALGGAIGGTVSAVLVGTVGAKISLMLMTFIATAFGVVINPLVLLGVMVAAITGIGIGVSQIGLQAKIKVAALEEVLKQLANNNDVLAELERMLREQFQAMTRSTLEAVKQAIDTDRQALAGLKSMREGERSDQSSLLAGIEADLERIERAREHLAEARVAIDQLA
jgi:hypothetical protein